MHEDMMDMDMEGDEPDYDLEDKRMYLSQAFPGRDWADEEIEAMADFVRACVEASPSSDEKKKGGSDLMLVFGGEPKKEK